MDELIGALVVIGLVLWGVSETFVGEREGIVKIDDCRETVTLPPDTFQKHLKTFTCTYRKTNSGKIMSGMCAHVDTASSLFSSSNACAVAYVYEKKSESNCLDKNFPYLGTDDKCHADYQY